MAFATRQNTVGSATPSKPVPFAVDAQFNQGEQRFDLKAVFHGLLAVYQAFTAASCKENNPSTESIAAKITSASMFTGYLQVSYARAVNLLPTKKQRGIILYGNTHRGGVVLEFTTQEILRAETTLDRHFKTTESLQGLPPNLVQLIKPDSKPAAARAN